MTLNALHILVLGLSSMVLLGFQRGTSKHRPFAALSAYLLIVSAGAVAVLRLFGRHELAELPQLFINLALLLALIAQRGNVVELFRHSGPRQSRLAILLRKETWL
ncbi:phage holin family protein [Chromobacterium phragmitis]|uniref:phage holin family protein n=1 Tax=Chromobacterium amazonense TaxID=1382803 RepID=UPI0021B73CAD|nr:phage holin family protein [Chromobacterium amazonense]MBM2883185.1 phage holin family protein [Chromobacterium amazonense]